MLDRRAQTLLKTLIERYVAEGQPIGSRTLSKYSGLELSPATIRNVMSDLEELGFIASPHTSAGRVPTPLGYRLFVDSLLTVRPLKASELSELRDAMQPDQPRRVMRSDMGELMTAALEAGNQVIADNSTQYVISGERNLLDIEDLSSNMQRLRRLFDLFEQKTALVQLLELSGRAEGVQVFIGGESGIAPLDECSVVAAPYEVDGQIVGTIGVIGPTRMAYERVIPIVDITARLLSSALSAP